jgi:CheY-like chemotaxis protein
LAARRRKLLLADDSPTIQKVVQLTFSDEGMDVTAVATGTDALAEIERARPDVVLADVHMPGVGGYELCERIKRDESLAGIPVVLLVGAFEPFSEAEARRVGADDVLTKPFQSIRELVGKVGSLFGGKPPDEARAADTADASRAVDARDERRAADDARAEARAAAPEARAAQAPPRTVEPAASFDDMDMDDRMIEARPAEVFGRTDAFAEPREEAAAFTTSDISDETTRMGIRTQEDEPADALASGDEFARAFDAPEVGFEAERRGGEVETSAAEVLRREVVVEAQAPAARAVESAFAPRFASAAAADDALLDLGRMETRPSSDESDESDDFVLDLDEDEPAASHAEARTEKERDAEPFAASFPFGALEEATETPADTAGAFAEAAHGAGAGEAVYDDSPRAESTAPAYEELAAEVSRDNYVEDDSFKDYSTGDVSAYAPRDFIEPRVVPSEEPVRADGAQAFQDLSVEGDIARPPFETQAPADDAPAPGAETESAPAESFESAPAESAGGAQAAPARLDAGQLPPEVIEQIARRAVEMLSEREVREIAWQDVPELAERLIKQRLDEIAKK